MNAHDLVRAKRDGAPLDEEALRSFVAGLLDGSIPDYQASALLMAIFWRGMTAAETAALTRVMLASGRTLRMDGAPGPAVDKHSTGGVGDKTSIPLLPIAASCGLVVPMISGRSLGHTGGTLDKLESIPGFRTALATDEIERLARSLGGCFAAQTGELVPADRRLYALRDATATVESVPLIVSSILSKKLAEGIAGVVIDVTCGRGAFMDTLPRARELARALRETGATLGLPVRALVTSMDEPRGSSAGNALEIAESIDVLRGRGPADETDLVVRLAGEMLAIGGLAADVPAGEALARRALDSGRALERFLAIVAAQGGRIDPDREGCGLPAAPARSVVAAPASGYLARLDAREAGETVRALGGGRFAREDRIDHAVGLRFFRKTGDAVEAGEPLVEILARSDADAAAAASRLARAIAVAPDPAPKPPLVLE